MFEINANSDDFVGYKVKIYPTDEQKILLNRQIELYRYVYNWSIDQIQDIYHETGKFTRYLSLSKIFSDFRNKPENEWLKSFPLNSARIAIRSAIKAFIYFFEKRNNFPVYKSKKRSKLKFGIRGERVYFGADGYLSIEGMGPNNKILYKSSSLPKDIQYPPRIYNVWVSFDKDDYWISFQYEYHREYKLEVAKSDPIGIDLGLRHLATLSNGKVYDSPNYYKLERRFCRLRKKVFKKYRKIIDISKQTRTKFEDMPKSNKLLKLEHQIRQTRRKIANKQNTFLHETSKEIVNSNPSAIVLETISPQAMVHVKNANGDLVIKKNVAREVYKQGLSKFVRFIEYKAKERNIPVIRADRDFPSSQICSNCGFRHTSLLGNAKIFKCPNCGYRIDRDLNAAYNLQRLAYQ